ncbi:MAG: hypothetical protein R3A44_18985 [Caldilineaceae bacterium]
MFANQEMNMTYQSFDPIQRRCRPSSSNRMKGNKMKLAKARKLSLGTILLMLLMALATPVFAGTLATESDDWAYPSAPTFTAVLGSQTITGNLGPTPDDGQDPFNVDIPSTLEVISVSYSGPDGPHNLVGCGLTGTSDLNQTFSSNNSGCQLSWFINTDFATSSSPWTVTIVTQNAPAPGDTTPPVITPNVSGTRGSNGWYTSPVDVSWSVSDAESTVSSTTGCQFTRITTTHGDTLTCEATSDGGANSVSITIKVDDVQFFVRALVSPAPNRDGWNNSDVTVSFHADYVGPSGTDYCSSDILSREGRNQGTAGGCVNNAGSSYSTSIGNINIDKTAPTVSVTGVTDGATYILGAVPTAGCQTSDSLSGVKTNASMSISGGSGNFTATCAGARDRADNSASPVSVSYTVLDNTPPVITPSVNGTLGNNGWYISTVEVSWSVSDDESTVSSTTGCESTMITSNTSGATLTCEATSSGGTNLASVTIKRDTTPPSANATVSPEPNANGWHNGDVTVSFNGSDPLSGIAACSPDIILSSEGTGFSASGSCTDNAGNFKDIGIAGGINIDKTAPVINLTGVEDGAIYSYEAAPTPDCETSDSLSGVRTRSRVSISGGNPDGSGSLTATCSRISDEAGNSAGPVSVSYTVEPADDTPPVITPNVSGTVGDNGWYISDVEVSWTVSDDESPVSSSSGCDTILINSDTAGTTLTCEATSIGGTSSASVTIKRDATPPSANATASPEPNANGWHNSDVTVSFDGSDALSGIAACSADAVLSSEGSGFSASGSCTDTAGNSSGVSIAGINIDKTAPVINASVSSTANSNDWHNSNVTVTFTCADEAGGSGIATNTVAGTTLSSDGANQSVTNSGECTDNAGNTASSVTVSGINIDKAAPVVSATIAPAANANGWHNSDVTVSFSGSDATSGIASCDPDVVFNSEGTGFSASGACTDNAGNVSATATASGINIDKTAPVVSVIGVADGATYTLGAVPTAGGDNQDALSGVATAASLSLSGANPDGSGIITAICAGALDYAGNSGSASVSYAVLTPQQATTNIQDEIAGLVDDGILKNGQANGLTQPLNNAIRSLDRGRINPACSQLGDFIAGVNALTPNPLDGATAASLIADAQAIQAAIGCASGASATIATDAATGTASIDGNGEQNNSEQNNKVFLPLVTS